MHFIRRVVSDFIRQLRELNMAFVGVVLLWVMQFCEMEVRGSSGSHKTD